MPPLGPVYVCLHSGTSLVSRLIRWHSRGDYSHASIVLPDGRHFESREGQGVLCHRKFALTNPTEIVDWFVLADPLDEAEVARLATWLESQVGKGYDWWMVAGFLSRSPIEATASAGKHFCSELVYGGLAAVGCLLLRTHDAWRISPVMLGLSLRLRPVEINVAVPS